MVNDKGAIIQAYTDLNSHVGGKTIFSEFQARDSKHQEESKNQKEILVNAEEKLNNKSLDA
jgi:hypothetical protein